MVKIEHRQKKSNKKHIENCNGCFTGWSVILPIYSIALAINLHVLNLEQVTSSHVSHKKRGRKFPRIVFGLVGMFTFTNHWLNSLKEGEGEYLPVFLSKLKIHIGCYEQKWPYNQASQTWGIGCTAEISNPSGPKRLCRARRCIYLLLHSLLLASFF